MNKFLENLKEMSLPAMEMMFYGTKLALGVLLIGIFAYKYNQQYVGSYENQMFCIELVRGGFSLFVQFIIGGIILDCAKRGN